MTEQRVSLQNFFCQNVHSLLFFEEFTFGRNKFTPANSSELEFADGVVLLGDTLFVYQIKERSMKDAGSSGDEHQWFRKKVLGRAIEQIRCTNKYLRSLPEIRVPNEKGRAFNIAERNYSNVINLVIYRPSANLPHDCRRIKSRFSSLAGFIHIMDNHAYMTVCERLRVPAEMVRYFKYREKVLTRFSDECVNLPEDALLGQFMLGRHETSPTRDSSVYVDALIQEESEFDITPILRDLRRYPSDPAIGSDYYDIIAEFAKSSRAVWRVIKDCMDMCFSHLDEDQPTPIYCLTDRENSCGFVFHSAPHSLNRTIEITGEANVIGGMAGLHAYRQQVSKCAGLLLRKRGEGESISWVLMSYKVGPKIFAPHEQMLGSLYRVLEVSEQDAYQFYPFSKIDDRSKVR